MGYLWAITTVWALFLTLLSNGSPSMSGGLLLIGWLPFGLLVWFWMARNGRREKAHAATLASSGVATGAGLDHQEGGTGIALNPAARTITLYVKSSSKTYSYDDVREWQAIKQGTTNRSTWLERMQAKNETGLFVRVRDVANPEWRIAMASLPTQKKWMEILRQELNENGAATRAA